MRMKRARWRSLKRRRVWEDGGGIWEDFFGHADFELFGLCCLIMLGCYSRLVVVCSIISALAKT